MRSALAAMSVHLSRWSAYRPDLATLRSAGFPVSAVIGVALVDKRASHSLPVATAAVLAASTAAGMHALPAGAAKVRLATRCGAGGWDHESCVDSARKTRRTEG